MSETLTERIERHEGYRQYPYLDTTGNYTVGIGHKITEQQAKDLAATLKFLSSDEGKPILDDYGGMSSASVGVLLRSIVVLEQEGSDTFFGEWIQVDGVADITSLPEAMDGLVNYYRQISGEHPDWDEYRAAMEHERRVLIRVSVERAGPDQSG